MLVGALGGLFRGVVVVDRVAALEIDLAFGSGRDHLAVLAHDAQLAQHRAADRSLVGQPVLRPDQGHAIALGADYIATGHYAQVRHVNGLYQLLKGEDGNKDQSYFLYRLTQEQLAKTLFPIGHLYKREVRQIAVIHNLPNSSKKDSTGICFIGERPFREFLNRYLPHEPGEIQTLEGKVIGKHIGLMYYTLGQRQGLGIGGTKDGNEKPWFVAGKDTANNVLIVVQGHDHPALLSSALSATDLTWISGRSPHCNWVYAAKTRYRQIDAPCAITNIDQDSCQIEFAQPQWAVTPGQSVVVYESNVCLGGGVIM